MATPSNNPFASVWVKNEPLGSTPTRLDSSTSSAALVTSTPFDRNVRYSFSTPEVNLPPTPSEDWTEEADVHPVSVGTSFNAGRRAQPAMTTTFSLSGHGAPRESVVPPPVIYTPAPTRPAETQHPESVAHRPPVEPTITSASCGRPHDTTLDAFRHMAINDTAFTPKPFNGVESDSDRTEQWLEYFTTYTAFRGISGVAKVHLFKLLLVDQAADWLRSLDVTVSSDFDELLRAFRRRYSLNDIDRWRKASSLWQRDQQSTESVDTYMTAIQNAARIVPINDPTLVRFAIIRGLRPCYPFTRVADRRDNVGRCHPCSTGCGGSTDSIRTNGRGQPADRASDSASRQAGNETHRCRHGLTSRRDSPTRRLRRRAKIAITTANIALSSAVAGQREPLAPRPATRRVEPSDAARPTVRPSINRTTRTMGARSINAAATISIATSTRWRTSAL